MSEKSERKVEIAELFIPKFHPAELVFAIALVALSVFLFSQFEAQTRVIEGKELAGQPGFWSWISIVGMLLFGTPYLVTVLLKVRTDNGRASVPQELLQWVVTVEYVLWFMAYVMLVPWLGYLLSTIAFSMLLLFRVGYSKRNFFLWALIFDLVMIAIFKGFLRVNIPGGEIYEYLPPALRNFMISNF